MGVREPETRPLILIPNASALTFTRYEDDAALEPFVSAGICQLLYNERRVQYPRVRDGLGKGQDRNTDHAGHKSYNLDAV